MRINSEKVYELNKWKLLNHLPEIGYILIIFIFCTVLLFILVLIPELRDVAWLNVLDFALILVLFTCIKCLQSRYERMIRILSNACILETKIIKLETTIRFSQDYNPQYFGKIVFGDVYVSTSYFDNKNQRQYFFEGYYNLPPYSRNNLFRQGKTLKDLKTVDVLVNEENYNEYVILLTEELEKKELY